MIRGRVAAPKARCTRSRNSSAAVSAFLLALLVALASCATAKLDALELFLSLPRYLRPKPPAAIGKQSVSILVCNPRRTIGGRGLRRPPALTRLAASGGSAEIRAEAEFANALNKLESAAFKGKVQTVQLTNKIYPEVLEVCPPEKRAAIELIMLRAFGRARKYRAAEDWFEKIVEEVPSLERNVDLWRALFDSYARVGRWRDTEKLAKKMRSAQVEPDLKCYTARMHALAKGKKDKQVSELFSELKQTRMQPDDVAYGTVMGSLGRTGQTEAAVRMLEEIKSEGVQLNSIHYGGAMNAIAKEAKRKPENRFRAFELLAEMKSQGLQPNIVVQSSVVSACTGAGDVEMAKEHLQTLEDEGWKLNIVSCTPVLKALVDQDRMAEAQQWLKEMQSKGVEPDVMAYNALLGGYVTRGDAQEACNWLHKMQRHDVRPNIVTLNQIVRAHAIAGNFTGAFEWLCAMPDMGIKPDTITYNHIAQQLSSFDGSGDSEGDAANMAENLLAHMSVNGVWPNKPTAASFCKILGKATFERLLANYGIQVQKLNDVNLLTKNKGFLSRDRQRKEQWRRVR